MSSYLGVRGSAPPAGATRGFVRWICTSNPFYVISAGLFLVGMWISFGAQSREVETWALMSGLAAYTLLLAVTGCLLVRLGNVWDDVRTVLLLVVLMFLATSFTFDEALVLSPDRGIACHLGGLLLAIAVSEGVLRGSRLALPLLFRGPYYVILSLFFLYPLGLIPLLDQAPDDKGLMWGLFGFSPVAGLAFLTLLPAARRGPSYVRHNNSPWRWPLYPWTLFAMLALAVPVRAYLLCWSHDASQASRIIFGPYFLIPFGLAITVLLLEIGLAARRNGFVLAALVMPIGLVVLALVGHRSHAVYREFLEMFAGRLGGHPLYLSILAATGFYAYAALRGARLATEALTVTLTAFAFVAPDTMKLSELGTPAPLPIFLAAGLQLTLGLWRHASGRCLIGAAGLVAALVVGILDRPLALYAVPIIFHSVLAITLTIGAVFDDSLSRLLRFGGVSLALAASQATLLGWDEHLSGLPAWLVQAYPGLMAGVLVAYGLLLGQAPSLASGAAAAASWTASLAWHGYWSLRELVAGLDYLALSFALFVVAVVVSLAKSGHLWRWLTERMDRDAELNGTSQSILPRTHWRIE